MKKINILPLIFFSQMNTWFYEESNFSLTNNRQIILKGLQETEKKIQESKSFINTILTISLGISTITSVVLYYATNNNYVIKQLEKENPQMQLTEIKSHVQTGFLLTLLITGILLYILYKYNQSQENIEEEIANLATKNFLI